MDCTSALLLGIALGLRHATDADHVVVVSALVQREPSILKAARVAALWGAGHTTTFLGLGLLIVLAGVHVPTAFDSSVELLVAAMLVGFGVWHIAHRDGRATHPDRGSAGDSVVRPILIGLVHGLAGSAGIALLAATTIDSRPLAAAYLCLFGLGTIVGMVTLTVVIARPIGWTMRRGGRLRSWVTVCAGLLSVALGLAMMVRGGSP